MTRSHWAADGGLLANRPIAPLLSTVFSRSATGRSAASWRSWFPTAG